MTDKNLFLVEHVIKDQEGWVSLLYSFFIGLLCSKKLMRHSFFDTKWWKTQARFISDWIEVLGAEDMTVDKGMQYPEWEGNECLLSCPDTNGLMTFCLWNAKGYMTSTEFQGASCSVCRCVISYYEPNKIVYQSKRVYWSLYWWIVYQQMLRRHWRLWNQEPWLPRLHSWLHAGQPGQDPAWLSWCPHAMVLPLSHYRRRKLEDDVGSYGWSYQHKMQHAKRLPKNVWTGLWVSLLSVPRWQGCSLPKVKSGRHYKRRVQKGKQLLCSLCCCFGVKEHDIETICINWCAQK